MNTVQPHRHTYIIHLSSEPQFPATDRESTDTDQDAFQLAPPQQGKATVICKCVSGHLPTCPLLGHIKGPLLSLSRKPHLQNCSVRGLAYICLLCACSVLDCTSVAIWFRYDVTMIMILNCPSSPFFLFHFTLCHSHPFSFPFPLSLPSLSTPFVL